MTDENGFEAEQEKLKQELKDATEYKPPQEMGRIEERLMNLIGGLDVSCPNCQTMQISHSARSKTCLNCRRSFDIFPKTKLARIVDNARMRKAMPLIHELSSLITRGRFNVI